MTERLLKQVCDKVSSEEFDLFNSHALIKATAKDYVRETQVRLILKPLAEKLFVIFETQENLESHLQQIGEIFKNQNNLYPNHRASECIFDFLIAIASLIICLLINKLLSH